MRLSSLLCLTFLSGVAWALPTSEEARRPRPKPKAGRQQAYTQASYALASNGVMIVNTNLGQAKGVPVNGGSAYRFVFKYASAARFGAPVQSSAWIMPNNDPSALPPACPQDNVSNISEDCLYAVAYVPATVITSASQNMPVYVWYHGGSFRFGSATDPGLDGTYLAQATNGIVIFVQYRLGVLGWLPPTTAGATASGNLGVKDAITSLSFIHNVMSFFGGNGQVTIGGQSSGGHLIRALIASPAAASLFSSATLHADPMNYGFMKNNVYQSLQSAFYSSVCNGGNLQCLQQMSVSAILSAQDDFLNNDAAGVDPSVGTGEPLRPHFDGTVIKYTLTTTYPPTKVPLLITSNKNDAGQIDGLNFPADMDEGQFPAVLDYFLGTDRANTLLASPFYTLGTSPAPLQGTPFPKNGDQTREAVERLGTDQIWRCANWDFARRWTKAGGVAYVGLMAAGIQHPDNVDNPYCNEAPGLVCHEDEILAIFGSSPSATTAQKALSTQLQARMSKFMASPSQGPNPSPYAHWAPATTTDARAIQIGGAADGTADPVLACDPSFWGKSVPFDWQVFGE